MGQYEASIKIITAMDSHLSNMCTSIKYVKNHEFVIFFKKTNWSPLDDAGKRIILKTVK